MIRTSVIALALLAASTYTNALVVVSTDQADFNLTSEAFNDVGLDRDGLSDITSVSGNISLDVANGVGAPPAFGHGYLDFGFAGLVGSAYVLNGDENFDVTFSGPQTAFAMTYEDDSAASEFNLTFLMDALVVGSASFTTSSFDTAEFIGFASDMAFNKVQVREDDGAVNTNEFFQFFTATAKVPEPSTMALLGLGFAGLLLRSRKTASV